MNLPQLMLRKYRHRGLRSLFKTSLTSILIYLLLTHIMGVINRAELKRITNQRNSLFYYGTTEEIEIRNPVPSPFESLKGTYQVERPFVCELSHCTLLGSPTPLGISPDRRVILETAKAHRIEAMHRIRQLIDSMGWRKAVSCLVRGNQINTGTEAEFAAVFPMVKRPDFSYYHWLTEYLPKIRGLEHYENATGVKPIVLIESNPPEWVVESLRLAGIPPNRWREWKADAASVERLVMATHREKSRGDFFHPSTEDYRWLQNRILSNIGEVGKGGPDDETFNDRIYISRQNARERHVINYDEVMDTLNRLGFTSYALEKMDVADQARLFSQAEIIIGPHGAGLVNSIFSKEPVTIIDMINEKRLEPGPRRGYYYFAIAKQFGYSYKYLACEQDGKGMIVDVNELENLVNEVTSS